MPSNDSARAIRLENESKAWDLRQQGWTCRRIAVHLGIDHSTVSRMLARVERRVLAKLAKRVEQQKVTSTSILDHVRDEALQAWEKSKTPRKRVVRKQDANGTATIQEATDREGEPAFLDRAIVADREIRRIWGIDAAPAKPVDGEGSGLSVSEVAARIKANREAFEALPSDEPPGPSDSGSNPEVGT